MESKIPEQHLVSKFVASLTENLDCNEIARSFPPETYSVAAILACAKAAAASMHNNVTATMVLSHLFQCTGNRKNAHIAFIQLHEEITDNPRILEEDVQSLRILFQATVRRFVSRRSFKTKYDEKSHIMQLALDGLGKALEMQTRFEKLQEMHSKVVESARSVAKAALSCSSILSKTGDKQDGRSQTGAKRPAEEALDILDSIEDVSNVLCFCEESRISDALEFLPGTSGEYKRALKRFRANAVREP